MPGFLQTTLYQGYDYLNPYVEKAQPYVEKARNNVPLVDPALKTAEELVPALITRADQIAEPQIEKMRPFVEPRIEQVQKIVAPYMDEGVKKYGVLREEGVKYYNCGLEKVEQVKGFKDAKVTQIREFEKAKETQIREFAEPRVERLKEFTEAKTTKIREFTDPKVEKIKELTQPTVEKIKEVISPRVATITARKQKMQTLLRVPGTMDLKGLNYETLLGKVASGLENLEAFIDRYLPQETVKDSDSDDSSASDSSCVRINRSVVSIVTKPVSLMTVQVMVLVSAPAQLKTSCMDGSLKIRIKDKMEATKAKIAVQAKPILKQVDEILAPKVKALTMTSQFQKVLGLAIIGSQKTLGIDKTKTIKAKLEACIPASWKQLKKQD